MISKKKPTPTPPRLVPSADGTFAQTVCDGEAIWRFGSDTATLRWDGQGGGNLYCWFGGEVYVQGADQWYVWTGTSWLAYGAEPPIPLPSPDMSPDGTCAYAIVDTAGNDWTIGVNQETLMNGEHMGGGSGSYYLWSGGVVYVYGVDAQWHEWSVLGWVVYGPNPPVPITPPLPDPSPIPGTRPPRLCHTSAWPQALCIVGTATPVVIYGITAFALVEQIAHGREADAVRFLDWCAAQRLNMVRVLLTCHNMFKLTPDEGRAALPRLLELAGARGLYVEVVCIADTHRQEGSSYVENYPGYDWHSHVHETAVICCDYSNTLLELVNEPKQPWQYFEPAELQAMATGIPGEMPYCLGAPDGANDENHEFCSPDASYQTVHADRGRAPWGNVRHIREQQVMSEEINQYVIDDEPGKEFTAAQQFAIGGLARVCMIGDTFHANGVRYATVPTGEELEWFLARRAGWDGVADGDWGTFANYGWTAPNPEPPIASVHFHDEDGRAYSMVCGDTAYTVLLNANNPMWKSGWAVMWKEERTSRADGVIETGLYHLARAPRPPTAQRARAD